MADGGNGGIPPTGDPRVDAALKRIWGKFKDLDDALLVQAHLEKKAGERIREHAELIAEHHNLLKSHEKGMAGHEERMKRIEINLAEMTDKVNFLIDREMRREGGPETR